MVLNKRILRELKANFARYFALFVLIAGGMFACIAMSAAADSTITTVRRFMEQSNIEDGRFSVFVPLSEDDLDLLREKDVEIETQFNLDITLENNAKLRIFQHRECIDIEHIDSGTQPVQKQEIMLERSFAAAHDLQVGDSINVAGTDMTITALGVAPDYDFLLENYTDTAANAEQFGIAFVSAETYALLREANTGSAEEYLYVYTLPENMTHAQLKKQIDAIDFDSDGVENPYVRELLDRVYQTRKDCTNGVNDLTDALDAMHDGLSALSDGGADLRKAADDMTDAAIAQASRITEAAGAGKLTKSNYAEILGKLAEIDPQFAVLKEQIDGYCAFADGIREYTSSVTEVEEGSGEIADAVGDFKTDLLKMMDEALDIDFHNISFFLQREANPRIGASLAKVEMYHVGGIITGAVLLILFAYICSIFVIGTIEQESQFIGALYAMGVHRRKIMLHYITLPVVITLIGGVIGTVLGYSPLGRGMLINSVIGPYSVPQVNAHSSVWLLLYGILMPPVLAAIVNLICLRRKLNTEPLRLLRKEQKQSRLLNIDLRGLGLFNRFRVRQILRELRITAAMFVAIVMGVWLLMLAIVTYVCIDDLAGKYEQDIPYAYCYYLKYPDAEHVPEHAEMCYSKNLNHTYLGYTLQVTVMGVEENSRYFPFAVSHDKNAVSVARGTAIKYGLHEGDLLCLHDDVTGTTYALEVDSIVPYSAGLNVFMTIDAARELFDASDDDYNMLLSDTELEIDAGRVLSVTTRESMISAVKTLLSDMMPMILMTGISAVAVYISVLYIMMKMMIDRSAFSISLIRIFGYHSKEIKRLYLDGNTLTVLVSTLFALPVSKLLIDLTWPMIVYNQPAGYASELHLWHYAVIFAATMLCYWITNGILVRKIQNITPAEVLKDRQ